MCRWRCRCRNPRNPGQSAFSAADLAPLTSGKPLRNSTRPRRRGTPRLPGIWRPSRNSLALSRTNTEFRMRTFMSATRLPTSSLAKALVFSIAAMMVAGRSRKMSALVAALDHQHSGQSAIFVPPTEALIFGRSRRMWSPRAAPSSATDAVRFACRILRNQPAADQGGAPVPPHLRAHLPRHRVRTLRR